MVTLHQYEVISRHARQDERRNHWRENLLRNNFAPRSKGEPMRKSNEML